MGTHEVMWRLGPLLLVAGGLFGGLRALFNGLEEAGQLRLCSNE